MLEADGRTFLELEDLTRNYRSALAAPACAWLCSPLRLCRALRPGWVAALLSLLSTLVVPLRALPFPSLKPSRQPREAPLQIPPPTLHMNTSGTTTLPLLPPARPRRPSIIDIKVGFRTWYPSASQAYIERCQ